MFKSSLWLLLSLCFCIACSAPSNESEGNNETAVILPKAKQTQAEVKPETKAKSKIAGIGACSLLSEATLNRLMPSPKGYLKDERNDDEGERIQCKIGFKEGFGSLIWSITYNEHGYASTTDRYDKNEAFKSIEVRGAQKAYILDVQSTMKVCKGNYLLTLHPPRTLEQSSNTELIKKQGIEIAEELLTYL